MTKPRQWTPTPPPTPWTLEETYRGLSDTVSGYLIREAGNPVIIAKIHAEQKAQAELIVRYVNEGRQLRALLMEAASILAHHGDPESTALEAKIDGFLAAAAPEE